MARLFLVCSLLAVAHCFHERTEPDLERTLAKSVKKSEAKDTKLVALEKSPNAPAKPFFYPFYYDEATMAKYKDAYTKYMASVTDNTKALYSNPIAWYFFWPYMMWWPWMYFYFTWMFYWPYMFWWW
jgi:hypothetical protein